MLKCCTYVASPYQQLILINLVLIITVCFRPARVNHMMAALCFGKTHCKVFEFNEFKCYFLSLCICLIAFFNFAVAKFLLNNCFVLACWFDVHFQGLIQKMKIIALLLLDLISKGNLMDLMHCLIEHFFFNSYRCKLPFPEFGFLHHVFL